MANKEIYTFLPSSEMTFNDLIFMYFCINNLVNILLIYRISFVQLRHFELRFQVRTSLKPMLFKKGN